MRVYLSGPMKGYIDNNFPAFAAEASRLRKMGFTVVSPHEIEVEKVGPAGEVLSEEQFYDNCLRADIAEMMTCETIITLPGWVHSRGARLEVSLGINVGMIIASPEEIFA